MEEGKQMLQRGFYVTVQDAGRHGFLLGPFASKREAEANVKLGKDLANAHNDWAWAYSYGTALVKQDIATAQPAVFDGHACPTCP